MSDIAEELEKNLQLRCLVSDYKAEIERLRAPFKHAVASDWDYLHRLLVTAVRSSEDQQTLFWLAVFKEARATYSKAGGKE